VTDGFGAMEFLKTLLFNYHKILGRSIDPEGLVLTAENGPIPAESLEGFSAVKGAPGGLAPKPAAASASRRGAPFRLLGKPLEPPGNNVIHGVVSASALNGKAREAGATITAFLAALLVRSLPAPGSAHRPVVVTVPVNLRKAFPCRSVRNFFGVVNLGLGLDPAFSPQETLRALDLELKEKTGTGNLKALVESNLGLEANKVARLAPLGFKDVCVNIGFNAFGENAKSVSLSNLGNVALPSALAPEVARLETVLYPTPKSPINCGVCSVNDRLVISFTRAITEADAIQRFFSLLASETGLAVTVDSNDWGLE
jgi:hypothetical protein